MPRFFTDSILGRDVTLSGDDARHISLSLRMRVGEELTLCDALGSDYRCRIDQIQREQIELTVLDHFPSPGEPSVRVTLYQSMAKGDKMDTIIQKSVELGVYEIIPVWTARCIVRPDTEGGAKRLARYNRIALEAAKQCGRGIVPAVRETITYQELLNQLEQYDKALLFYERAENKLGSISLADIHTLALVIGSEGGFEELEAEQIRAGGALVLSLGSRILRCETAPIVALSALMFAMGEF